MSTFKITELVKSHCKATKPSYNMSGFVQIAYGITRQQISNIASGKRNASPQLLRRLNQAHVRLFPTEPPVTLLLPNQPPILLGHPSSNN